MTERRVFLASLLSILFLSFYSQVVLKNAPRGAAVARPLPATQVRVETTQLIPDEEVITIESPDLLLELGQKSAAIRKIILKRFASATQGPLSFLTQAPIFQPTIGESGGNWTLIQHDASGAAFEHNSCIISYAVDKINPLIKLELNNNSKYKNIHVTLMESWRKSDALDDRRNPLEAFVLLEAAPETKPQHKRYFPNPRMAHSVPRRTSQVTLSERYFCQSIKFASVATTSILPSPQGTIAAQETFEVGGQGAVATIYVGPRDFFYLRRAGFAEAVPIGTLGKIGLVLLSFLSWIAGVTHNYGVGIIMLSLLVTGMTAPLTLIGFRSMKKMQELKPRIDKIMAQHKGDPTRANREVFELYRQHKVSPLSGCLPVVLQMPIFIALFQAISHFIELRGQSFLWIRDLSLPDRFYKLPFSLPLVGNYLNLLPLIMAAAMYVQTKMSQPATGSDKNPMAAAFSGPMMSVVFGVMFYQFQAGLVLYWLTNSLLSLVWYRLAKA